jgi:hypothetical protein
MARRVAERTPGEAEATLGRQFRDARDRSEDVAAARRLTRIRWRESMVEVALEQGELKLANDILDSIAKEASAGQASATDEDRNEHRRDEAEQARERIFRRLDALRERLAGRDAGAAAATATRSAAERT